MARQLAKITGTFFLLCIVLTIPSQAQTLTTLVSFDSTDGANPYWGSMVQGKNGEFYGTTFNGGANGQGSVFSVSTSGELTTLYNFCSKTTCTDGANPEAGLVLGKDGSLYGTTDGGGANGFGTVFAISQAGKLRTVYSFCSLSKCSDGGLPTAALVQGTDGDFYGTTFAGGVVTGQGTVFKITPAGKLTTLYAFCKQKSSGQVCLDGSSPYAGLTQAKDGNFYGTTYIGGEKDAGTIFRVSSNGKFQTVYSFCALGFPCVDGQNPSAGLVQDRAGNLYGATSQGGAPLVGTIFKFANGKLTTLYTFCNQTSCLDGALPFGGLVLGLDGKLYGTTQQGGANDTCSGTCGTIFSITTHGTFTKLYDFCAETGCTDGDWPRTTLVQGTDRKFYGETYYGGSDACFSGCGTVFSLSVGSESAEAIPAYEEYAPQ